ncbi:MAG: esterase [Deltaproteobacteria bacterium]|nr:esterase [Deltaproteobacteria bacterium]
MGPGYTQAELGGLQTLVVAGAASGLNVAVLHGYGADAFDLLPLCREIDAPAGTTWLFPHAPLQVEIGPHTMGRAWFPIDLVALQLAMLSGRAPDMSRSSPPELARSRSLVAAMLHAAGAPLERTVLMGFSQGAMVATSLALESPVAPAGLAILSGTLLDEASWRNLAPRHSGLRFVQSHGRDDPLLSHAVAQRLHHLLNDAGWRGQFVSFGGGHEIPGAVIAKCAQLLREVAPGPLA